MKILHTSDWHLGRTLYGRSRYVEFEAFLDWLVDLLHREQVDALVVAGDIFDTTTPSNRAQELYYRFLCRVAALDSCRHVVIVGGNHDSPSFLNAPAQLLRALDIHVVGASPPDIEDEIIVLRSPDGSPRAVVAAVPYLRDRDIRTVEAGESMEDKQAKLLRGIRAHYSAVCGKAHQLRTGLERNTNLELPLIATGHLFSAGGKTTADDGVRELYIGSLAHVDAQSFPQEVDYLALGHLHVPQRVGGEEDMRYSGSPLPMGFGEAAQRKQVVMVEFAGHTPQINTLEIPCFQPLQRIKGSLDEICARLDRLKQERSSAWLEIEYTGTDIGDTLREQVDMALDGADMEVLSLRNSTLMNRVIHRAAVEETLDDLDEFEVFERCLDTYAIEGDERTELNHLYREIVHAVREEDSNAE
ncbi:MAG: exonuclease SbcCD subunit D C-terminal domain-containing protein [Geobacteraceae bacterium]|nr:exonuclease SbcCD subunit D C-terminal domain-containing protein [Geobacteraceae bacterium]